MSAACRAHVLIILGLRREVRDRLASVCVCVDLISGKAYFMDDEESRSLKPAEMLSQDRSTPFGESTARLPPNPEGSPKNPLGCIGMLLYNVVYSLCQGC